LQGVGPLLPALFFHIQLLQVRDAVNLVVVVQTEHPFDLLRDCPAFQQHLLHLLQIRIVLILIYSFIIFVITAPAVFQLVYQANSVQFGSRLYQFLQIDHFFISYLRNGHQSILFHSSAVLDP